MKNSEEFSRALSRTQVLCSKSEKSEYEILMLLEKWGVNEDLHDEIIQNLKEDNFLNIQRYAESFTQDKSRFNKWGKLKISYALQQKRIPEDVISKALSMIDEDEYKNGLENLLKKKIKSVKANSQFELRAKLFRFASSRGFHSEEIYEHLDKIILE